MKYCILNLTNYNDANYTSYNLKEHSNYVKALYELYAALLNHKVDQDMYNINAILFVKSSAIISLKIITIVEYFVSVPLI